jgi:hypothetical protein
MIGLEIVDFRLFVFVSVIVLTVLVFYYRVSMLRWTESERRDMERQELSLSVILRFIDAADGQYLLRQEPSRKILFFDFSKSMKEDVLRLAGSRDLSFTSLSLSAVFLLSYYLLRLKCIILCARRDLFFLSGLQLALFRSLEGERV